MLSEWNEEMSQLWWRRIASQGSKFQAEVSWIGSPAHRLRSLIFVVGPQHTFVARNDGSPLFVLQVIARSIEGVIRCRIQRVVFIRVNKVLGIRAAAMHRTTAFCIRKCSRKGCLQPFDNGQIYILNILIWKMLKSPNKNKLRMLLRNCWISPFSGRCYDGTCGHVELLFNWPVRRLIYDR